MQVGIWFLSNLSSHLLGFDSRVNAFYQASRENFCLQNAILVIHRQQMLFNNSHIETDSLLTTKDLMVSLRMYSQMVIMATIYKSFQRILNEFHSSVFCLMLIKGTNLTKQFPTIITRIGSLPRMNSLVIWKSIINVIL